jgi:hypothetical protein
MFRTLLKATAIILLGTLSLSAQNSTSAASGVPRLVNYSGKATDGRSKPLSGTIGITFAIYRDQEGGCRAVLKGRTNSIRCKFSVLKDRKTISSCT